VNSWVSKHGGGKLRPFVEYHMEERGASLNTPVWGDNSVENQVGSR